MFSRGCVILLLAIVNCFCNRHATLPAALCETRDDCVGGEDCIEGKCLFTQVLALEMKLTSIYSKAAEGDLVIEARRCLEQGDIMECDDAPLVLSIESPKFPEKVKFNEIARGNYLITGCIDLNHNGACNASELGKNDIVKTSSSSNGNESLHYTIMTIKYPLPE